MKEMIKRIREEKGGFTLAELLIVVAIILVLVAIAVPVFTGALNNAQEAVAKGDIRSVKAEAVTYHLLNGASTTKTFYTATIDEQGNVTDFDKSATATAATSLEDVTKQVEAGGPVTLIVEVTAEDLSPEKTPAP